jgi:copper chaperone
MPTELTVDGMACDGCEATVEEALEGVAGVTGATADHERDTVSVEGDADSDDLVTAIEAAGYEPSV